MKKFAIIYGNTDSKIQKSAIEELTRILLDYSFDYPVCTPYDENTDMSAFFRFFIGTKETNAYIKANSDKILSKPEEYYIKAEKDSVIIEGFDEAGVLYGVIDFYNKYVAKFEHPESRYYWKNFFENDELPSFEYSSAPTAKERGLWTWGHVIYDYRGYLDNMMKLKMNKVIIWNDFAPVNAKEIVEYAHARNIKVVFGFSWLWASSKSRLVNISNLEGYSEQIFSKYEKEYSNVGADGIYFQTFTEMNEDSKDGLLIAEAAAKFVNQTASLFFGKYPDLKIEFGLHATSVKNRLEFIKLVDPRIFIIWEDCGSYPFAWLPTCIEDFSETKSFIQRIANLRGDTDRFGVVTKAFVMLDWSNFEHLKGSQCIGVSTNRVKENRIERKSRIWRRIQAGWLINADKALEMIKEMCDLKKGDLSIHALVEDGMFEENILYPVALYSEMLWNCNADIKSLTYEVSLRNYVTFA